MPMGRGGMGMMSLSGLALGGFVIYIVLGSTPQERIARVCKPIPWSENVSVSLLNLMNMQKTVPSTQRSFEKADYGCQYTTWRLFYQSAYEQSVKRARQKTAGTANSK